MNVLGGPKQLQHGVNASVFHVNPTATPATTQKTHTNFLQPIHLCLNNKVRRTAGKGE